MSLSDRDVARLKGVNPDLATVVVAMGRFCPMPFMVIEGVRTLATKAEYVKAGDSQTMNSRHLTGHAVDLAPVVDSAIPWDDWPVWEAFAVHMKGAAAMCGIPVEWGGDWTTLVDGPHWQLPRDAYPVEHPATPDPNEPVPA
jgi:peptidoglycan L-alanyl-D-glutamate endopeptidase CwlK